MKLFRFGAFLLVFAGIGASSQAAESIAVAPFQYHGPATERYLAEAAQDSLMGALSQQGYRVRSLPKALAPEALKKIDPQDHLWVVGSLNVVGDQRRVRVKWLSRDSQEQEAYLNLKDLNELLPELEKLAQNQIRLALNSPNTSPAPIPEKSKSIEASPVPPKPAAKTPNPVAKNIPAFPVPQNNEAISHDYQWISERLPFEVRGLDYADLNADGQPELILTSKNKIHIYHFDQQKLEPLTEYEGKERDFFVKAQQFTDQGKAYLAVTNLRGELASSKILAWDQGKLVPVAENIPYLLRVASAENRSQLLGSTYRLEKNMPSKVFVLKMEGNKIKAQERLSLPSDTYLYDFAWTDPQSGPNSNFLSLSNSGKIRLFEYDAKTKGFEKTLVGRETYGGTGNYVPVEVKNFFNEVVGSYYGVPATLQSIPNPRSPSVLVVRQNSLLKDVVGKVPVISSGELVQLRWDGMGFSENWVSKKVDGSIQDYLVLGAQEKPQALAAVRLKNPGLLGEVGKNESVLLRYDLNR